MGWCSGTDIFDEVVHYILVESSASEDEKYNVLYTLIQALESADWDCQGDSVYYDDPLVQKVFADMRGENND